MSHEPAELSSVQLGLVIAAPMAIMLLVIAGVVVFGIWDYKRGKVERLLKNSLPLMLESGSKNRHWYGENADEVIGKGGCQKDQVKHGALTFDFREMQDLTKRRSVLFGVPVTYISV